MKKACILMVVIAVIVFIAGIAFIQSQSSQNDMIVYIPTIDADISPIRAEPVIGFEEYESIEDMKVTIHINRTIPTHDAVNGERIGYVTPRLIKGYMYEDTRWARIIIEGEYKLIYLDFPFSYYSFFIKSNLYYYIAFANYNPDMPIEDILWKVNASLHLPFYTNIYTDYRPCVLLVNKFNRLPSGFVPEELVTICRSGVQATPATRDAFNNMVRAARAEGVSFYVGGAFRSARSQANFYNNAENTRFVARPYHSEHQTGRALDLLDSNGDWVGWLRNRYISNWLARNMHYFGFIQRYRDDMIHITGFPGEPWHITYVGGYIAMYMFENAILTLEEFVGRNPGACLLWPNCGRAYAAYYICVQNMLQ